MYKYSIIVPIYNVEKYLTDCLNSIENQTFGISNLEVILINDKSLDNSHNICIEFAKKYKNVTYICNEMNLGLGTTRNKGASLASGEFIYFLDSDDILELNMFEEVDKVIKKNPDLDLISFNYERFYDNKKSLIERFYKPNFKIKSYKGINNNEFLYKTSHAPWTKVYRHDYYGDFKFENCKYEDIKLHSLIYNANKIINIEDNLIKYRIRKNSFMTEKFNFKKESRVIIEFEKIKDTIPEEFMSSFESRYIKYAYIYLISRLIKEGISRKIVLKYSNELKNMLNKENKKYFSLFEKLIIFYLTTGLKLTYWGKKDV